MSFFPHLFTSCCPGNSLSLRKRYDALHAAARQRKELVDEAVTRRQDFDKALDSFLGPLGELEAKCDGLQDKGESKPAHIQERVETIRVCQGNTCVHVHVHRLQLFFVYIHML